MKSNSITSALILTALALSATSASAAGRRDCVTKAAVATSATADQAKWFALETTVQAVSWSLWPGYVASSKVEGYNIHDRYKCDGGAGSVTCHVEATFCKK